MKLTKQIQLANCEILRQFFFDIRNRVLDIEANDLANRQLSSDRFVSQQRKTFEQKLVFVVFNDCGSFGEKVCGRRDRYTIMMKFVAVVGVRDAFWKSSFARIHPVPKPIATGFSGTAA